MKTGIAALLKRMQIANVVVPPGDPAEQLIANLALSVIAAEMNANAISRAYLTQAHGLAVSLEHQRFTYRPPHPSKFVRLIFAADGEIKPLLLPIINNILVVPVITCDDLEAHLERPDLIKIMGLEVTRFMLRIRTRKTLALLERLKNTAPLEQLADTAGNFLTKCLNNEISSAEPLDRTEDCLELARDLLRKRNFALASLALTNADLTLDLYMKTLVGFTEFLGSRLVLSECFLRKDALRDNPRLCKGDNSEAADGRARAVPTVNEDEGLRAARRDAHAEAAQGVVEIRTLPVGRLKSAHADVGE
jgi:hypothetical protein